MTPGIIRRLLTIFSLLSALCFGLGFTKVAPTDPEITQKTQKIGPVKVINSQEARKLLAQQPKIIILDVRTPQEFAAGHLQKAKLINFKAPDFAEQINRLDPNQTYLVYCAVGGRSKQATDLMQIKGFKLVYNVSEGFSALKAAGIQVK